MNKVDKKEFRTDNKGLYIFIVPVLIIFLYILFLVSLKSILAVLFIIFIFAYMVYRKNKVYCLKDNRLYTFGLFNGFKSFSILEIVELDFDSGIGQTGNIIILRLKSKKTIYFNGGSLDNTKNIIRFLLEELENVVISNNVKKVLKR